MRRLGMIVMRRPIMKLGIVQFIDIVYMNITLLPKLTAALAEQRN